jgi:hypothetical protein
LKVLIVHDDLDAVRFTLVMKPTCGDGERREKTDREDGEQDPTVRHVMRCSPENNKTRREAGLAAVA